MYSNAVFHKRLKAEMYEFRNSVCRVSSACSRGTLSVHRKSSERLIGACHIRSRIIKPLFRAASTVQLGIKQL